MLQLRCILHLLFILSTASLGDLVINNTPNGIFEGVESLTVDNQKTFFAFLGIRYGKAPVGNLRFRAPVPVENWFGKYNNATKHGNQCVQYIPYTNVVIGAEDCLFINVYTTQLPNNIFKPRLPVLVYIHGGGFVYSSGDLELHGADRFMEHGVVFVSLNYRLGIFGFMSTEDNIVPGNYGLKDQVLALQWVKKYIANFGGDPSRVTIFGESAGAVSVNYLRQAPRASGLFTGVIANSGNTLNPWSISLEARKLAFKVGRNCNISASDSTTLVKELRKVDAEQLQISSLQPISLSISDILNDFTYAPTLEVKSEEAICTKCSYEIQKCGHINPGPLLLGFNDLEGRYIQDIPPEQKELLLEEFNNCSSSMTPSDMNANDYGRKKVCENILSFYFHNQPVTTGSYFAHYFSDHSFVRGIIESAKLQSRYSKVYLYNFSFIGGAVPGNLDIEGVSHSEELQYLLLYILQHTAAANLTAKRMVEMWTNFAKTGNPTSTRSEAVRVNWPLVNAPGCDGLHYLDIGNELVPSVNPSYRQMKFWYEQYSEFGNPPYCTY